MPHTDAHSKLFYAIDHLSNVLHSAECKGDANCSSSCEYSYHLYVHCSECTFPQCSASGCCTTKTLLQHYRQCGTEGNEKSESNCLICRGVNLRLSSRQGRKRSISLPVVQISSDFQNSNSNAPPVFQSTPKSISKLFEPVSPPSRDSHLDGNNKPKSPTYSFNYNYHICHPSTGTNPEIDSHFAVPKSDMFGCDQLPKRPRCASIDCSTNSSFVAPHRRVSLPAGSSKGSSNSFSVSLMNNTNSSSSSTSSNFPASSCSSSSSSIATSLAS